MAGTLSIPEGPKRRQTINCWQNKIKTGLPVFLCVQPDIAIEAYCSILHVNVTSRKYRMKSVSSNVVLPVHRPTAKNTSLGTSSDTFYNTQAINSWQSK